VRHLARNPKLLEVLHASTVGHRVGDIGKGLRRLADWDGRDHFVDLRDSFEQIATIPVVRNTLISFSPPTVT
jgi:hypothetical protein